MTGPLLGFGAGRWRDGERDAQCVFLSVSLWVSVWRPRCQSSRDPVSSLSHWITRCRGCVAYLQAQSHLSKPDTLYDRVIHATIPPPTPKNVSGLWRGSSFGSEPARFPVGEARPLEIKKSEGFEVFAGQRFSVRSAGLCRIETRRQRAGSGTHGFLFGRAVDGQEEGLRRSEGCLEMKVWTCEGDEGGTSRKSNGCIPADCWQCWRVIYY